MYFSKTKTGKTLAVLLLKNIDKEFSGLKILSTRHHISLNHGPVNLLFHFNDS